MISVVHVTNQRFKSSNPRFINSFNESLCYKIMFSYYTITFGLILAATSAQEHLTCLRTDTISSPSNIQPPYNIQRGFRGKQGPKGEKGDSGEAAAEPSFNSFRRKLKRNKLFNLLLPYSNCVSVDQDALTTIEYSFLIKSKSRF